MNYKEARDYIKKLEKSGINLGLERMKILLNELGNIDKEFKIIHIAGTNGKGSVLSYLSSSLAYAGFKVGRYSSPQVFCHREIISFETYDENNKKKEINYISKDKYAKYVNIISEIIEKNNIMPTAFEIETAMAFLAFKEEKCNIIILETGLGGRLDATNFISNPLAEIICPVSFDHKAFLGDSIAEIAYEKAGIIKDNSRVYSYQKIPAARMIIKEVCQRRNSILKEVSQEDISFLRYENNNGIYYLNFSYKDIILESQMPALYQMENAALAFEVLNDLKEELNISQNSIEEGIRISKWSGRFQILENNPVVIIDGAHNLDGIMALNNSLKALFPDKKYFGIFGCFKDKEYEKMIDFSPKLEEVVTIDAAGERAMPKEKLSEIWKEKKDILVNTKEDINEALAYLKNKCEKEDIIIIYGSLSFLRQMEDIDENCK